jgi:hypothetical protein
MTADKFAIIAASCVFAGVAIGLFLQHYLPDQLTTGGPRDMIAAVVGLLTLLAALVLGLLIWTAYGVYSSQNAAIQSLAARDLQLDLALSDYGPEARNARLQLRDGLRKTIDEIWRADTGNSAFAVNNFSAALRSLRARQAELDKLHPSTDQQTRALAVATATVDALAQARLQMSFALSAPISLPLDQHRPGLGGVDVLRLRAHVERQSDVDCHRDCRRVGGRVGLLPHHRPQQPIFGHISNFASAD